MLRRMLEYMREQPEWQSSPHAIQELKEQLLSPPSLEPGRAVRTRSPSVEVGYLVVLLYLYQIWSAPGRGEDAAAAGRGDCA